ncbi:unnamed protein product [Amoebophrya sp. A25]|nr:unnamed protein product [Amoebophrya sp. A25]|eukprot:GSA25T00009581001.1
MLVSHPDQRLHGSDKTSKTKTYSSSRKTKAFFKGEKEDDVETLAERLLRRFHRVKQKHGGQAETQSKHQARGRSRMRRGRGTSTNVKARQEEVDNEKYTSDVVVDDSTSLVVESPRSSGEEQEVGKIEVAHDGQQQESTSETQTGSGSIVQQGVQSTSTSSSRKTRQRHIVQNHRRRRKLHRSRGPPATSPSDGEVLVDSLSFLEDHGILPATRRACSTRNSEEEDDHFSQDPLIAVADPLRRLRELLDEQFTRQRGRPMMGGRMSRFQVAAQEHEDSAGRGRQHHQHHHGGRQLHLLQQGGRAFASNSSNSSNSTTDDDVANMETTKLLTTYTDGLLHVANWCAEQTLALGALLPKEDPLSHGPNVHLDYRTLYSPQEQDRKSKNGKKGAGEEPVIPATSSRVYRPVFDWLIFETPVTVAILLTVGGIVICATGSLVLSGVSSEQVK